MNGKAKYPYFSRDNYVSKWRKYNDLILQLEGDEVHSQKLDKLCCEIAQTGMYVYAMLSFHDLMLISGVSAGGVAGIDSDGDTSNDEDYAVDLD
jgi:hypothetical protein